MISTAPDYHLTASPNCRVAFSSRGRIVPNVRVCPTVRAGIVSSSSVQSTGESISSAPDDHFIAGPDCAVVDSANERVRDADGGPTVRARIVSSSGIKNEGIILPTPDDHFTAGPDCAVVDSGIGRVSDACGCPAIICA